jgi:hypothetical protein
MRLSIEFKTGRYDGNLWFRITPRIEGSHRQRLLTVGVFLTILTIGMFALAGSISPDPMIKPDQTVTLWGNR